MSGMIGVIAQDTGRYTMFPVSLTSMQHPPNTALEWRLTSDRIIGRNSLAKKALEIGAEWLMFLDDDHACPPNILMRLLSHDLPVVGALYLQRQQPFTPIAYESKNEDGIYTSLDLTKHAPDAVVPVAALGTGGMLIRSEVLRAMDEPWFEHGRASEDMMFCDKVYELGLGPVYVDLAVRMGHMTISSVWPTRAPGVDGEEEWAIGFTVADGCNLTVPFASAAEVIEDEHTAEVALAE